MKVGPTRWAAAGAAMLLAAGAMALWATADRGDAVATPAAAPMAVVTPDSAAPDLLPAAPPAPSRRTREERRFARVDRDDDGRITQAEYLAIRRRNFDRLDRNGDGRLAFEEYASKGIEKFVELDASGDKQLDAAEFAEGAPKPRSAAASIDGCRCPPAQMAAVEE